VRCVNTNYINFYVRTLPANFTFNEVNGIDNQCYFVTYEQNYPFTIDNNCNMAGVDVTSALNAALAAGNSELDLALFDQTITTGSNPNFCNPFLNPNVTKYNNFSNCGAEVQSSDYNPSSFYIVVTSSSSTTMASSTTASPTSASCASANTSGQNVATPGRKRSNAVCSGHGYCSGQICKCIPGWQGTECQTQTPSTTCNTENTSGQNNASPARSFKRQSSVCSGHGTCNGQYCNCNAGWLGADCETPASPSCSNADTSGSNNASPARSFKKMRQASVCSGNGYCLGQICVCKAGFSGNDCQNASTTPAPTANTSGDNNAKEASSAAKYTSAAGLFLATCVAMAL
jgi:hypothetical protein